MRWDRGVRVNKGVRRGRDNRGRNGYIDWMIVIRDNSAVGREESRSAGYTRIFDR